MHTETVRPPTLTIDGITVPNPFKPRYENFIGNRWVAPRNGLYSANFTPIDGRFLCEVPRSGSADIELALDAAHNAQRDWSHQSPTRRARLLNRVTDRIEQERELLALAETLDNGKPIRETQNADIPIIFVTLPPACEPTKAASVRSMQKPMRITSWNPSALLMAN